MQKGMLAYAAGALLFFSMQAAGAAQVFVTATGTIHTATGTMSDLLGQTITVNYLIDLNPLAATSIDTDSSDNPLEDFSAIYTYFDNGHGWNASASGGGTASSGVVSILTEDNIVDPLFNSGNPFDGIDIWGSDVTAFCPPAILSSKGYCDDTDLNPGAGVEVGLYIGMGDDWFAGTDLPTYIPGFLDILGAEIWGLEFDAGLETGEFAASIDSLAPSAVPVPAAVWLFGSGLIGLAGLARRRA